ncbi:MAG: polysaccharide biosynthesis tyrosine autokinase [Pseudomonadota bacterium]|nr:polysaccharide biosynthesis tyrosine autokinase [Pseudomonadota bacterium]
MNDILKKALERTERETIKSEPETNHPVGQEEIPPLPSPPEAEKNTPKSKVVTHKKNFIGSKPTTLGKTKEISKSKKEGLNLQSLEDYKIIHDCRIHPAADQVKILRTQLLQRLLSTGGNSVLVTSPKPGEGKTVNAINLAISIAQEIDRTVLLIDANLRKPAIHKYFGFEESMGLADYLLGKASISEVLLNPGIDKLTILPGGRPLTTSSEVLGAARMADLVKEMKDRYEDRILVFDGPDILTSADSQVFSKLVDGIVLVVEAEKTTRQEIKQAIERLGESPLIGTIFNKSHE